jgi:hypothetical protein
MNHSNDVLGTWGHSRKKRKTLKPQIQAWASPIVVSAKL